MAYVYFESVERAPRDGGNASHSAKFFPEPVTEVGVVLTTAGPTPQAPPATRAGPLLKPRL